MNQQGRDNMGRGYGGRGSGWQQYGHGCPATGCAWGRHGDAGGGGGRQGGHRGLGACGGRECGGAWQQVAPAAAPRKLADSLASDLGRMKISPSPVQRTDRGGSLGANNYTLWLGVSNFALHFYKRMMIYHYDVIVTPESLPMAVKAELFRMYAPQFPVQIVAYDGQRNLLSPALLPEGDFWVALRGRLLHVALKLLKAAPLQELHIDVKDVMYFV